MSKSSVPTIGGITLPPPHPFETLKSASLTVVEKRLDHKDAKELLQALGLVPKQPKKPSKPKPENCDVGSFANLSRHRRNKEPRCNTCSEFKKDYDREYKLSRGQKN